MTTGRAIRNSSVNKICLFLCSGAVKSHWQQKQTGAAEALAENFLLVIPAEMVYSHIIVWSPRFSAAAYVLFSGQENERIPGILPTQFQNNKKTDKKEKTAYDETKAGRTEFNGWFPVSGDGIQRRNWGGILPDSSQYNPEQNYTESENHPAKNCGRNWYRQPRDPAWRLCPGDILWWYFHRWHRGFNGCLWYRAKQYLWKGISAQADTLLWCAHWFSAFRIRDRLRSYEKCHNYYDSSVWPIWQKTYGIHSTEPLRGGFVSFLWWRAEKNLSLHERNRRKSWKSPTRYVKIYREQYGRQCNGWEHCQNPWICR